MLKLLKKRLDSKAKLAMYLLMILSSIGMFFVSQQRAEASNTLSGVLKFYKITDNGEWRDLDRSYAEGGVTGTICAKLPISSDEEAALILAVYSKDGQLLRIDTDNKIKDEVSKTLSAQAKVNEDESMRCFVFNNLNNIVPQSTADENSVSLSYSDAHSIVLSCEEKADKYIVSRDGAIIGESVNGRFIDGYLRDNTVYTYAITPITNEVEGRSVSTTVLSGSACTAILGEEGTFKNISFVDNDTNDGTDSYTENAYIGGRSCRKIVSIPKNSPTRTGMMYFAAKRSIIPEDARQVTFEVTYFDNGNNDIFIEYNSVNDILAKPVKLVTRENTNTWKTARVSVNDANFRAAPALQNSDFRIKGGADTYISKVHVEQTQFFGVSPAYADFTDLEYPETGNIIDFSMPDETGGQDWNIHTKENIFKNTDTDAVVTLEIDSSKAKKITFTYQTKSSAIQNKEINTGTQERYCVVLPDAVLENGETNISFSITNYDGTLNNPSALKYVSIGSLIPQSAYSTLLGNNVDEKGIFARLSSGGDSYSEAAEIGGRPCRKVTFDTENSKIRFLYFDLDDRYAFGEKDSEITIEVDYFDLGSGSLKIQYNSKNIPYKETVITDFTNDNQWKTAKITLDDACFTNSQNYISDFRISGAEIFYIGAVRVTVNKTNTISRTAPQIFLASDSTCESLSDVYFPREGWGMEIGNYFKNSVQIVNKAKGGKSSRTFLNGMDPTANPVIENDGRMESILSSAQPGDYLFIQFGHNDRPSSRPVQQTDPYSDAQDETSYRYNLKRFIDIARANEMIPIFITSIHERNFIGDTDVLNEDGIEPYRQAMREVGAENNVPVLDIGASHKELVERWGNIASKELFLHFTKEEYPNYPASLPDNTHISKTGATEVAKLVASAIRDGAEENLALKELADWLDPDADLTPLSPPQS
jgi:lysophospholipase L1-like esterase